MNHSSRTFLWGSILADLKKVRFDRELFYVASLLHDLGLTDEFAGPRCFELESASAAARFVRDQGWEQERSWVLAEAIRLHMQARVVMEDGTEAYLLSEATACDVRGKWLDGIDLGLREYVIGLFPRLDFKTGFVALFDREAEAKPGCMADIFMRRGLADAVREAPFDG